MSCPRGCCDSYAEHVRSIGVSAAALPTRKRTVAGTAAKERQWDRDMPAYQRLKANGLQPPRIDGARELEQRATIPEQVESGMTHVSERAFRTFKDEFGHKPTEVAK